MPRLFPVAALLAVLAAPFLSHSHPALAATQTRASLQVLVELRGAPLAADPNLKARSRATRYHFRLDPSLRQAVAYRQALTRYQNQEIDYVRHLGVDVSVGRQFNVLFNGFSATVPLHQLGALRNSRNVLAVLPDRRYRPLLDRSVPLINAPAAWQQLGGGLNAGKGEMIADIDSGIDITSPCFKDAGFAPPQFGRRADTPDNFKLTNNKVVVARAFGSSPTRTYSAADQTGHGTFTAAIEACDYNTPTPLGTHISGVAPDAYLMNYNVFPDGASDTSDSQILAALSAALLDGADVVNMSLGTSSAGDPRLDAEARAVELAIKAGVSVVISAGNAGPIPESIGSPATTPDAIAVGAVTNARGIYSSIAIGGSPDVPAALKNIRAAEGSHAWQGVIGPAQMVYVGLGRSPDASSGSTENDFAGKDLHGKIALIQRGTIFFETKINNAAKAGAVGAIIFDNQSETNLVTMDVKSATLPAMFISKQDGQALLSWLQAHPDATATMNSAMSATEETPGVLTDFSSRGYGVNYGIKPDLVAPGADIYSATETHYPSGESYNPSGFLSAQGTSFSAPHVTGAVALMLQAHPKWTPAMIKSALMDTAGTSDVYLNSSKTGQPSVEESGAGLLDVGAAFASTAYLSPASLSFGGINVGYGPVQHTAVVTLKDIGNGQGTWQATVQQLNQAPGLTVSVPATVDLSANGSSPVAVHLAAAPSTPPGNYDGYLIFTNNGKTLHIPYFVHVASRAVKSGSVLLVDVTTSRFHPDPGQPPLKHLDVSHWYEQALQAIGKTYTYWDAATQGTPSLQDMKRASAVIYYTGSNFNGLASQNSDPESQIPPLTPTDMSTLHSYLDGGGKVFVSGMGAALSDPYWTGIVLGGVAQSLSVYDVDTNAVAGGTSPPRPSSAAETGKHVPKQAGIFAGLKRIDFSTKGDGAHDNVSIYNTALQNLIGVPGLVPISGSFAPFGRAHGQPALKPVGPSDRGVSVAVVSSDEPSLGHRVSYRGRSVLFGFGFEGINNNTGYATRAQVLRRVFQWLNDKPSAQPPGNAYSVGKPNVLRAGFKGAARPVQYVWQIAGRKLAPSTGPLHYRFSHPGKYKVRVQVTDALGHVAVSSWRTIVVRRKP